MQNHFQVIGMKKLITITDTNSRFNAIRHQKLAPSGMLFFIWPCNFAAPVVFSDPSLLTYMVKSTEPPAVVCGLYFCTSWQRGKRKLGSRMTAVFLILSNWPFLSLPAMRKCPGTQSVHTIRKRKQETQGCKEACSHDLQSETSQ